ncbi:DUF2399 domain-containing protein [Cryptosporangium sp. NPDC051539]|uniref:DUF2399 domain-containing protein n=1 Tax=Cryptosporangium sp. NPDC051539 TaxID=3363962 RepID=UPI00379D3B61
MTRARPRGFRLDVSPLAGLDAYALPRADGTYEKDRRGRDDPRRVTVEPAEPPVPPVCPDDVDPAAWSWFTASERLWATIAGRFADSAEDVMAAVARAGGVRIEYRFAGGAARRPPVRTIPDETLAAAHRSARTARSDRRTALAARAAALADELRPRWPGAAASLAAVPGGDRLFWAVAAGSDLAAGRSSDSRRAFVQRHTGDPDAPRADRGTKAREDVTDLLAALGWEADALFALGLVRSPYLGIGGPLVLTVDGHPIRTGPLPGPHSFRITAGRAVALRTEPGVRRLTVVENRQAAETVCDGWPDEAVVWCPGQPADPIVALIAQAAGDVDEVLLCPDADLGGVRIAGRIVDRLERDAVVLDAGSVAHPAGVPFHEGALAGLAVWGERDDGVGSLARACRARGYAVEQEDPVARVLRAHLRIEPAAR